MPLSPHQAWGPPPLRSGFSVAFVMRPCILCISVCPLHGLLWHQGPQGGSLLHDAIFKFLFQVLHEAAVWGRLFLGGLAAGTLFPTRCPSLTRKPGHCPVCLMHRTHSLPQCGLPTALPAPSPLHSPTPPGLNRERSRIWQEPPLPLDSRAPTGLDGPRQAMKVPASVSQALWLPRAQRDTMLLFLS